MHDIQRNMGFKKDYGIFTILLKLNLEIKLSIHTVSILTVCHLFLLHCTCCLHNWHMRRTSIIFRYKEKYVVVSKGREE